MKNIFYLILTFIVLSPCLSNADSGEDLFRLGNEAYTRSDYDSAITCYQQLERSGKNSVALYFNMGNTFFRLNKAPMAVLYYEKAKKLDPADEDILKNIALTNSKLIDRIKPLPENFFPKITTKIIHLMSPFTYGILLLAITWSMFIFFAYYMRSKLSNKRRFYFYSGLASLVIFIFLFWVNVMLYLIQNSSNTAILFNESEYIMSSPNDTSKELFLIHEGTKVIIIDKVGDWSQIKLVNGDKGWIPSAALVII